MTSDEFNQKFGADLGQALVDAAKVTRDQLLARSRMGLPWATLGHRARGAHHGTRTDIKGSADELETFAKTLVAKRAN